MTTTPEQRTKLKAAAPDEMYCETCHRVEAEPIMLDGEICGCCGDFLSAVDVDAMRDDRDERRRLAKEYDDE